MIQGFYSYIYLYLSQKILDSNEVLVDIKLDKWVGKSDLMWQKIWRFFTVTDFTYIWLKLQLDSAHRHHEEFCTHWYAHWKCLLIGLFFTLSKSRHQIVRLFWFSGDHTKWKQRVFTFSSLVSRDRAHCGWTRGEECIKALSFITAALTTL